MSYSGVTSEFGALALAVFIGAFPVAVVGFLTRALRTFRRI